jgi:hypothetical protein
MKTSEAIKNNYQTAQMVCGAYLGDLSDSEAMQRPHAGCNHINWQVGHIIASENKMGNAVVAGALPDLPEGFADKYSKETVGSDNAVDFVPFSELLAIAKTQGDAVVAMLDGLTEAQFDEPGPEEMQAYAPNMGALCNMMGSHWMMHAGQWVVVRRELGREIMI